MKKQYRETTLSQLEYKNNASRPGTKEKNNTNGNEWSMSKGYKMSIRHFKIHSNNC